jgi:REP-associated tyrosine transposase
VTQRGTGQIAIVRDDIDRRFFVRQLTEVARRFGWLCYVFCLMDNHFHLVIETERLWLSGGMHRLSFLHAQRFNRRYERVGHLFQNRFGARIIEAKRRWEPRRAAPGLAPAPMNTAATRRRRGR